MIQGYKARYGRFWYGVDELGEIYIKRTNPRVYVDIQVEVVAIKRR